MSYKSPIEIIYGEMIHKLENEVFTAVQNIGINVDKDELIKALQYDRDQYRTGYSDAMINAVPVVRCKDCKHRFSEITPKPDDWFCADGERMDENDRRA